MVLWIFIGIVALLILLPLLMGLLMPPLQRATRVELIRAPLDVVWDNIADLPRQTQWRSDLKNVQFKDDDQGTRWIEQSSSMGTMTVRKKFEDEQREVILILEKGKMQGKRHLLVSGVPGGTRLTINEERVIPSPLGRLFNKIDKQVNQYIDDLQAYFVKYNAVTANAEPALETEVEQQVEEYSNPEPAKPESQNKEVVTFVAGAAVGAVAAAGVVQALAEDESPSEEEQQEEVIEAAQEEVTQETEAVATTEVEAEQIAPEAESVSSDDSASDSGDSDA